MSQKRRMNRRQFVSAAAAAVSAPYFVPASALGGSGYIAPSNRVTMGFIGVGGKGTNHIKYVSRMNDVQIPAICDVDVRHRERAAGIVADTYAETRSDGQYKGVDLYNDFRELIARDDIDTVLIATPDHWHSTIATAAMKAGKDPYTEKPFSLTVPDGQVMLDTCQRYNRVLQNGSHERSRANVRYACELVRNGRIGKLHTIRVNMPVDNHAPIGPQPVMQIPPELDYDMWLGPAPWAPYTEKRCHFSFRYIMDYSGGEMTDRGAHILDIAQLGNGSDHTTPIEVEGSGWAPEDGLFNTFMKYKFHFKYANGVDLVGESIAPRGIRFEGTDGWIFIYIHGGNLEASNPDILRETIGPNELQLGRSPGHMEDFIHAVRTRGQTMAPPLVGHHTATMCHTAIIAMRLGRKLKWDPATYRFVNDDAANRMLARPMREPWHV